LPPAGIFGKGKTKVLAPCLGPAAAASGGRQGALCLYGHRLPSLYRAMSLTHLRLTNPFVLCLLKISRGELAGTAKRGSAPSFAIELAFQRKSAHMDEAKILHSTFCLLTASVATLTTLSQAIAILRVVLLKETTRWLMAP